MSFPEIANIAWISARSLVSPIGQYRFWPKYEILEGVFSNQTLHFSPILIETFAAAFLFVLEN